MRQRRVLLQGLLAATVLTSMPARAADEKTLRIGILSSGAIDNRGPLDQALVEGLRQQGYVEGRNLVIERRYSSTRVKDNALELAGMHLDAILTTCTPSTRIMKETTSSTPIVMAAVSDPVRQGIVASLARPGQNVTGTSSQAEDLLPKRLELIVEALAGPTTIAVLANANNPVHALGWERLAGAAMSTGMRLVKLELRSGDDLPGAMELAARSRAGALLVLPDDPTMFNLRPQIVALAAKHRLPDFYWAREFVESGGLMSYGENLCGSYRNAAMYMDKIKRGADAGTLPVAQPTRFELVVNLNTAKALGLAIPQSLLVRADELIR